MWNKFYLKQSPAVKYRQKMSKMEILQSSSGTSELGWRTQLKFWGKRKTFPALVHPTEILSKVPPKIPASDETVGEGSWSRSSDWRLELSWCESINAGLSQSNKPSVRVRAPQQVKTSAGIEREICLMMTWRFVRERWFRRVYREVCVDDQESFSRSALGKSTSTDCVSGKMFP